MHQIVEPKDILATIYIEVYFVVKSSSNLLSLRTVAVFEFHPEFQLFTLTPALLFFGSVYRAL